MSLLTPGFSIIAWMIVNLLLIALFVFLGKWIYGWYAEIKKRNRLLAAQVKLLAAIAERQGVDADFIQKTIDIANTKNGVDGDVVVKS